MTIHLCSATDPGLTRSNNEDSVVFDGATGLCILADGMGGNNAGEVASGMATACIKKEMNTQLAHAGKTLTATSIVSAIEQCVTMANRAIYSLSKSNVQYAGMGTTLVMGVFHEDLLVLGHIGDSRCYRLREGEFLQLTRDHSVLQEQIDAGMRLSGQESIPNLLTRGLGTDETVAPEINQFKIEEGDIYLMCSDGLSDMVSDEGIATLLSGATPLTSKTKHLAGAANACGGRDNITVLLAQVGAHTGQSGLLGSARRALRHAWSGLKGN